MVRVSTPLAVLGGVAGAALVTYTLVATAKPKRGSWRHKFKSWVGIKWPLTYRWLTAFDDAAPSDDAANIAALREVIEVVSGHFTPKRKVVRHEDVSMTARDGTKLTMRVHVPPAVHNKPLPVVYYIHGGAWVAGSLASGHTLCQVVAHDGPFLVVAIDYRLAPEHPFPTPLSDCLDGLDWVFKNANRYGGDPNKIALLGDSAGGNLLLAVSKANVDRDPEHRIPVRCQTPVYPITDCDFATESYKKYGTGFVLGDIGEWMFQMYTKGTATRMEDERVSVLRAKDVSLMPPTQMITAEWDILRDDGFKYVEKLKASKVDTEHLHYLRSTHGFFSFPTIGSGTDAKNEFVRFVRQETAKFDDDDA